MNFNKVILHCSATREDQDIGFKTIDKWHKGRGWKGCGYHFIIRRDGTTETGRPVTERGAHARGYNDCIGVCLVGGVDERNVPEDNFTQAQHNSFFTLMLCLRMIFGKVELKGHRDLPNVAKACPSFDVVAKYGEQFCNE
tara:strand:+ start:2973 stop:3392 length:420 start_codon:yes stop_codon:yes gene_type:complete